MNEKIVDYMYEEAIIIGLGFSSFIFAYIASLIHEDRAGILKLLFLSISAINVWVMINIAATMAEANSDTVIANMIWTNSNILFLIAIFASGLWLFALLIIWVLTELLKITGRIKEPGR